MQKTQFCKRLLYGRIFRRWISIRREVKRLHVLLAASAGTWQEKEIITKNSAPQTIFQPSVSHLLAVCQPSVVADHLLHYQYFLMRDIANCFWVFEPFC